MTIRDLQRKYSSAEAEARPYTTFLSDIRAAAFDPGILTSDLRILLDRKVAAFLPEGERICAGGEPAPDDRQALTEGGLTVAALMLILMKMNSAEALREAALLFLQYCATAVKSGYDFTGAALDAASRPIASLGFRWKDIEGASALDIIAYKFIRDTRYRGTGSAPLIYSGRGSVQIRDGRMEVSSFYGTESGAEAFRCLDGRITVVSRSVRDERLKSSARDEVDALAEFGRTYLETLERSRGSHDARREPADGEIVDIEYCWDARRGCYFRMLDDDHPLTGRLEEEDLVAGLSAAELEEHIYEEDCIRGAVLRRGPDSVSFSIRDAYRAWAKRTAEGANRANACFDARHPRPRGYPPPELGQCLRIQLRIPHPRGPCMEGGRHRPDGDDERTVERFLDVHQHSACGILAGRHPGPPPGRRGPPAGLRDLPPGNPGAARAGASAAGRLRYASRPAGPHRVGDGPPGIAPAVP